MAFIFATAGSHIFIGDNLLGPKSVPFVATDFNGQSWVEINWVQNMGKFGDTASEIKFDAVGESRTLKLKGVRDAGNLALVVGVVPTDLGQQALRNAQLDHLDYAFRVDFNDARTGGLPSQRFFIGKVMSVSETLNTANTVVTMDATIAIDSNIVVVNAT